MVLIFFTISPTKPPFIVGCVHHSNYFLTYKPLNNMVKIIDYKKRFSAEKQKEFFALTVQGDLEILKSASGGNYLSAPKISIPSTFDEATCISLIGKELPGRIVKQECEAYSYTIESTGEVITLNYKFEYVASEVKPEMPTVQFYKPSANGAMAHS
jgi:hypothetical protein